jgi:hypothetical protein
MAAKRVAKYGLEGWIGIMDTPSDIAKWRKEIDTELVKLDQPGTIDSLEIMSMLPFEITREKTDQADRGKASNNMVGTAQQITDDLKRYRGAGLTMPLLWPPFAGTPTAKMIGDLRRLRDEILPKL